MRNANIDLLAHLWDQLDQRLSYCLRYNSDNKICHGAESDREFSRLNRGYLHFGDKFAALVAEMQEFLYLGGEVKKVHEVVGAAVQKELDAVLDEVRKGQSE